MTQDKPVTLLKGIKENWKFISDPYYPAHLTVFWKDGKKHWHVKAYPLKEHWTKVEGMDRLMGSDLREEDYKELLQVADKCQGGYCSTAHMLHKVTPSKKEKWVRDMLRSPEGFRQMLLNYAPGGWRERWEKNVAGE